MADIHRRIEAGACEMTGMPFSLLPTKLASADPFSPSLDRMNSRKGYTRDNVRVVATAFNFAKGQWSLDIFEAIARGFIERNRA